LERVGLEGPSGGAVFGNTHNCVLTGPFRLTIFSTAHENIFRATPERVAEINYQQQVNAMNQSNTPEKNTEKLWETPVLREIPVSFEATSYALADDDPLNR
jgi:coenzyme PQQ precursor peptide PqqA